MLPLLNIVTRTYKPTTYYEEEKQNGIRRFKRKLNDHEHDVKHQNGSTEVSMKFAGVIGFKVLSEVRPSVWQPTIIERMYRGDVNRVSRRNQSSDKVNDDMTISNEIEILADAYAFQNFQNIQYVTWLGANWKVGSVSVEPPRLILEIGGVYNGETGPQA